MDDIREINIKPAKNGWLLEVIDENGREFELFEHEVNTDIDLTPERDAHRLPAMCDMLTAIGRHLLQLNPKSQETIAISVSDRPKPEEELIGQEVEKAIDRIVVDSPAD